MRFSAFKSLFFLLLLYPTLLFSQIRTGSERTELFLSLLKDKRVAICGNQTSRIGNTHLVDTLFNLKINIVKVFAPEHGFRGEAEAGALIKSGRDPITNLPVVSLYGNNKKPTPEQMKGIDIIIFDIQDVGCRFYTYISTLHYIMEAAAEQNVKVLILDRPNPNGYFVDGPVLEEKFKSFVGMHPIPVVHGMTIGEYALMINGERWLSNNQICDVDVIKMEGYDHNLRYFLPFYPSPNLKTDESIYLYPSLCLFEGTEISLGRGTEKPFQIFGHPQLLDGDYYFTPIPIKGVSENPPQNGIKCRGYDLTEYAQSHLHTSNSFDIKYLLQAYQNFPNKDQFFLKNNFFDKLAGNSTLRWQIINGRTEKEIRDSWQKGLIEFKKIRKQYLLYPDFE
ncbi:MAG: DUF1343 domain-containing protein [Bacteroidetes bacterium HGW-Bacteroidetes-19]|nr:MAG: DUF1343 domain-containing protein [Bacteroidetes bacterium HGW-Bacteroidetes-20]PKP27620.1 MAG: DUF1343 domain-containing protein [Bacteroidetes bacterium HGW-Bacteroidetes-19]